jgi:DNA invertase Pin-like site-specific DNA recombinase
VSQSVELQEEKVRAYCVTRDLELVEPAYRDLDVSGGDAIGTRPAGLALLARIKQGGIGAVVVLKLDRLFRCAADCLITTELWEDEGVGLHIVDLGGNSIDTTSAAGRFMLTVLAGAAEMERNLVRERTSAALSRKRSRGEKTGGRVPYGYEVYDDGETRFVKATGQSHAVKKLRPVNSQQNVIETMKSLRAQGRTLEEICELAGAIGRRKFWPSQVSRILGRAA